MNKIITPKPGDVFYCKVGVYRMYVKLFESDEHLLCIDLNTGEAYAHNLDNSVAQTVHETFAFNMNNVVTSNMPWDT